MKKNKLSSDKAQNLLLILCWAIYTLSYLGRYTFKSNIVLIMDDYGVSRSEAGMVESFFFFAYGLGQFINGFLCKYYPKKITFPIVFTVSGLINLSVFLGIPFGAIKYLWLVNGLAQSILWSSVILILSDNLDEEHMNKAYMVLGTTTACGVFVSYFSSFLFVSLNVYKAVFLFSASVLFVFAVVWLILYRPTGIRTKKEETAAEPEETKKPAAKKGSAVGLFGAMVIFGVFSIECNFAKDGLQTWVPDILRDTFTLPDNFSILLTLLLPLVCAVSGLVIVYIKKLFKGFAGLCSILFGVISAASLGIIFLLKSSLIITLLLFALVAFCAHSVNAVTTEMVPFAYKDRINSGKTAGILDGCCYIGSTLSSYGLGKVADLHGWNSVFTLLLCSAVGVMILGLLVVAVNAILRKKGKTDRVI